MIHLDPKQESWTALKRTVEHMSKRTEVGQTVTAAARMARVRSAFSVPNREVQELPGTRWQISTKQGKEDGLFI